MDGDGNGMERIMYGILNQDSQSNDRFITTDVTNFLIPGFDLEPSDLVSRNIQRGRDHGMPTYNDFREFCRLPRACSWNQPPAEIRPEVWARLRSVYRSPADIELFPGGLAEVPFDGGIVGRTFNCLISEQFRRLKFGDRFFFTHSNQVGSFSDEQLANLRLRNLGDIICDTTDIPEVRDNVFLQRCGVKSCGNHNKLNIRLFL